MTPWGGSHQNPHYRKLQINSSYFKKIARRKERKRDIREICKSKEVRQIKQSQFYGHYFDPE